MAGQIARVGVCRKMQIGVSESVMLETLIGTTDQGAAKIENP